LGFIFIKEKTNKMTETTREESVKKAKEILVRFFEQQDRLRNNRIDRTREICRTGMELSFMVTAPLAYWATLAPRIYDLLVPNYQTYQAVG
jgi:hypothetical protein